ncbi:MAG: coproporphyrinogen III oxidase [Gammaproteobacteria bacterium]|nr:coproporphyrinogen III oxidase [Gammaproteobacteria bacterium]
MDIDRVIHYLQGLQASITNELQAVDGSTTFVADTWERTAGGGGRSMVLRDGQ